MGKILTRYLVREITIPFFISLLIFTCILFTTRMLKLVELVVNKGVSVLSILKMLFFVLPSFFEVTVPMAFLLAILSCTLSTLLLLHDNNSLTLLRPLFVITKNRSILWSKSPSGLSRGDALPDRDPQIELPSKGRAGTKKCKLTF